MSSKPVEHVSSNAQCVWPIAADLGEGAVWVESDEAFFFVDIRGCHLHRWRPDSGERRTWSMPQKIGFALPRRRGGLLLGLQSGIHFFDAVSGTLRLLIAPEPDRPTNRLNDAFIDPQGRLWFGTMDDLESERTGGLYRLDAHGDLQMADSGYCITNGPAMCPQGRRFYHTDTLERCIYVFDAQSTGSLSNKQLFYRMPESQGYPDGTTVDAEGGVWVSHWAGARITRLLPDATVDRIVELPCPNVTSCAFGGADLATMLITTARKDMTADALALHPLAGGVFTYVPGVRGLPQALSEV